MVQCTNCMDGEGYKEGEQIRAEAVSDAATIRKVAALAIAIDNALQLYENYKSQSDIAKRSVAISRKQQQQLQDVYWPRELEFLNEFATNAEPIEDIAIMSRRYGGRLQALVAGAFAQALKEARCNLNRYCTSSNQKTLQDLMLARGTAMANARILGNNIAFAEYQARTDTNFNRRMQAVALGRGLLGDAAKLLSSASGGLAASAEGISTRLNSALQAFGYANNDPRYQQDLQRIMAQGSSTGNTFTQPYDSMTTTNGIGYQSLTQNVTNIDAGWSAETQQLARDVAFGTTSAASQSNPFSTNQGLQMERWNNMNVGDKNLISFGQVRFPVIGGQGGYVIVDFDKAGLRYGDDEEQREPGT